MYKPGQIWQSDDQVLIAHLLKSGVIMPMGDLGEDESPSPTPLLEDAHDAEMGDEPMTVEENDGDQKPKKRGRKKKA